jgi:hypothetical protein
MFDDSRRARENRAPLFHRTPSSSTTSATKALLLIESYRWARNSQNFSLQGLPKGVKFTVEKDTDCALEVALHLSYSWRVSSLGPKRTRVIKEKAMRKVLLLALVSMFFTAAACSKSEETAPAAPEAAASAAASDAGSPAAAASPADASSPAAPASPAAP